MYFYIDEQIRLEQIGSLYTWNHNNSCLCRNKKNPNCIKWASSVPKRLDVLIKKPSHLEAPVQPCCLLGFLSTLIAPSRMHPATQTLIIYSLLVSKWTVINYSKCTVSRGNRVDNSALSLGTEQLCLLYWTVKETKLYFFPPFTN